MRIEPRGVVYSIKLTGRFAYFTPRSVELAPGLLKVTLVVHSSTWRNPLQDSRTNPMSTVATVRAAAIVSSLLESSYDTNGTLDVDA
jgi:hypothetical protein